MVEIRRSLRFEALDSWRGLCALWVVLYHFRALSHVYDWTWVRTGDIAVDFFFVLSGFVITHAYGEALIESADRVRFLIRRFGRLYPLHIATLAVVLMMELGRWGAGHVLGHPVGPPTFSGDTDLAALPANVVLVHAWGLFRDFTWNIPSWSISVEWALCLVYVLLSFGRRPLLAALVLAVIGFGLTLWLGTVLTEGQSALIRGLYGFFLGVLAYRLFAALHERALTLPGWLEWLAPLLLVFTVLFKRWHLPVIPPLLFAAMVLIFAAQAGPISRLMRHRVLTYLGEISYSIYLVHYVLVLAIFGGGVALGAVVGFDAIVERGPFNAQLINMPGPWVGDLAAAAFLLLTIGVASLTYRWIENPGRRWFNQWSNKVAPKPQPALG
ncbi:MAG: acyltransferase [Caulobacter sp.]|nr:acyltransferase [Caulobacter sp.]